MINSPSIIVQLLELNKLDNNSATFLVIKKDEFI